MTSNNNKPIRTFAKSKPAGVLKNLMAILIFAITVPAFAGKKEGLEAFERGDFQTVLKVANEFVEKGDPQGAWSLGWLYENGKAVPQDYNLAASWYTKASEQGLPDAQSKLGQLYEKGLGVPQDYNLAASWYTKAAQKGLPEAQNNLGRLYEAGQGVTQDYKLAEKWLTKAADEGYVKAQYNLGVLYQNGHVADKDWSAMGWYKKAAEQGYAPAQNSVGKIYDSQNEFKLAVEWYAKAVEQNDADAQANLGLMYESGRGGRGVDKSYILSYALYELSGRNDLRANLIKKMGSIQIRKGQELSKTLAKPGNIKEALRAEIARIETVEFIKEEIRDADAENKIILDKWIGRSERELITHRNWGIPQQSYQTGGINYVLYDFSKTTTIAGTPSITTTQVDTQSYSNYEYMRTDTAVKTTTTGGLSARSFDHPCKVIFETHDGRLGQWLTQGYSCWELLGGHMSP